MRRVRTFMSPPSPCGRSASWPIPALLVGRWHGMDGRIVKSLGWRYHDLSSLHLSLKTVQLHLGLLKMQRFLQKVISHQIGTTSCESCQLCRDLFSKSFNPLILTIYIIANDFCFMTLRNVRHPNMSLPTWDRCAGSETCRPFAVKKKTTMEFPSIKFARGMCF